MMILESLKELFATFTYSLLLLFSLFRAWFTTFLAGLNQWIPEPLNGYEEYLPPLDVWIYATCFLCVILLHRRLRRKARSEKDALELRRLEEGASFAYGSEEKGRRRRSAGSRKYSKHDQTKLQKEIQRHWSPPAYPWPVHVHQDA